MTTAGATREINLWLSQFEAALDANDAKAVAALFAPEECYWRDFVAFTWTIVTLDGRAARRRSR